MHYAPVKITDTRPRSPRYLSEQERVLIADLLAARITVRGIAASWGARRRRSVARSAETAILTDAIDGRAVAVLARQPGAQTPAERLEGLDARLAVHDRPEPDLTDYDQLIGGAR